MALGAWYSRVHWAGTGCASVSDKTFGTEQLMSQGWSRFWGVFSGYLPSLLLVYLDAHTTALFLSWYYRCHTSSFYFYLLSYFNAYPPCNWYWIRPSVCIIILLKVPFKMFVGLRKEPLWFLLVRLIMRYIWPFYFSQSTLGYWCILVVLLPS